MVEEVEKYFSSEEGKNDVEDSLEEANRIIEHLSELRKMDFKMNYEPMDI